MLDYFAADSLGDSGTLLGVLALRRSRALGGEYGQQGLQSVLRLNPSILREGISLCDNIL